MELMNLVEDWKGYKALSESERPENYEQQLKETIDLISNARNLPAHRHEYELREALTTSDFPYLFGDVLDRQVMARYKTTPQTWKKIAKVTTRRDFRTNYTFRMTGGDTYLDEVPEKGEYLASDRGETKYEITVKKYGRQFDISWESIINDDLNALGDTAARFSDAASRTEQRLMTNLFAGDVGTHTADANLYEVGENADANDLTIGNLETAIENMADITDGDSPIMNRPKYLVVPPALEMTARQILTSSTKMWLADSDDVTPPAAYPMNNVLKGYGLELVVDPWLPLLDATSDDEGWYLFADPAMCPALEGAYLKGHERPEICMKNSDKMTVGGSVMSPFSGDFATDNIMYRVRHCFGAGTLDWRGTYMGGYQG